MRIGVIGIGFVGNAMVQSFMKKNIDTVSFDTFKKIGNYENMRATADSRVAQNPIGDSRWLK